WCFFQRLDRIDAKGRRVRREGQAQGRCAAVKALLPRPGGEGILPKHTGPALGPPFSLCGPLRLCVLCV
ncbi:MAG: hypothetical protein OXS32_05140, partial [Verrucomicrobiales bacterium]|nr:hypothetical protein [Verrucomicrobiales bacterium]